MHHFDVAVFLTWLLATSVGLDYRWFPGDTDTASTRHQCQLSQEELQGGGGEGRHLFYTEEELHIICCVALLSICIQIVYYDFLDIRYKFAKSVWSFQNLRCSTFLPDLVTLLLKITSLLMLDCSSVHDAHM